MTDAEEDQPPTGALVPGLAMAGAALLLAGTFCPVVVLPSGAAHSYRDFAETDGNIILGAAVVAFVVTWVFRWYRGLFAVAGVAVLIIGATLLKVTRAGLGEAALTWGWLPLAAGAVLVLAAALVAEKQRPPEPPPDQDPTDE